MLSPESLGLPVEVWRDHQLESICQVIAQFNSGQSTVILDAPTGSGKSMVAIGVGKWMLQQRSDTSKHFRIGIVTATKQLQNQYLEDFETARTVMGRSNFPCIIFPEETQVTTDDGPCKHGWKCPSKGICPYFVQRDEAAEAEICVMNYQYFLNAANYTDKFTDFDLLILDECHLLDMILTRWVGVSASRRVFKECGTKFPHNYSNQDWQVWATENKPFFADWYDNLKSKMADTDLNTKLNMSRKAKNVSAMLALCKKLAEVDESWIQLPDKYSVEFKPTWPTVFTLPYVLNHGAKVLLMSATVLSPDIVSDILGIGNHGYIQTPSTFDPERRKIYYAPAAKMTARSTEGDYDRVTKVIDHLIRHHAEEKILIHCNSYRMRDEIVRRSTSGNRLISHASRDREQKLEQFVISKKPLVMLSPSMHTGVDLPYDQCRVVIIAKVPYPYLGDPQVRARLNTQMGKDWYAWDTACTVVQAYGRGMRAPDDFATTYIVDESFGGFYQRSGHLFPKWFEESYSPIHKQEVAQAIS